MKAPFKRHMKPIVTEYRNQFLTQCDWCDERVENIHIVLDRSKPPKDLFLCNSCLKERYGG